MSRRDREVRQWHFWRKAFWTRPAFFVAYAVISLVVLPFVVRVGLQAWGGAQALRAHRICGPGVSNPCLDRVTGQLHGPFSHRMNVNQSWELWKGDHELDGFDLGPRDSNRLQSFRTTDQRRRLEAAVVADEQPAPERVTTLDYDGQVIVVELPDDAELHSTLAGLRGLVQQLCLSLVAVGVAVGCFRYARKKRASTGSWWAVEGSGPDPADLLVVTVVFPATFTFMAMQLGAPWWLAVMVMVPFLAYVVTRMVGPLQRGRRARPEHLSR
jgi:hypothetical protein